MAIQKYAEKHRSGLLRCARNGAGKSFLHGIHYAYAG